MLTSFQKWSHRTKFWYDTVYQELLILIFQFLTNYVKDFTEDGRMNRSPLPINLKVVHPLLG